MGCIKRFLKRTPIIRECVRVYIRRKKSVGMYKAKLNLARAWSFKRTEFSNYYYDITIRNRKDLAFTVSHVTSVPLSKIESYFCEVEKNREFKDALQTFREDHYEMKDSTMEIARRIGWYAFVRAIKPRLVVETGVHHGVGALTICAALERNHEEGFKGRYIGVDINPESGTLLKKPFNNFGEVIIGDSLDCLKNITTEIDLFINDSDHSEEYEAKEYAIIKSKLGQNAIILGDNSHASDALRLFSAEHTRDFLFFKEEPLDHFYSGAGIGISFRSTNKCF